MYKVYLTYRNSNNQAEQLLIFDDTLQPESYPQNGTTKSFTKAIAELAINDAGTFNFSVYPDNVGYEELLKNTDLNHFIDVTKTVNGVTKVIFTGRVYSATQDIHRKLDVYCEGALSFLNDGVFAPDTYDCTLPQLVTAIINEYNTGLTVDTVMGPYKHITVGSIRSTETGNNIYREYVNYESSMNRLADLLESVGGYITVTKASLSSGLVLNWVDSATHTSTQKVKFQYNMLSLSDEESLENVYTRVVPYGAQTTDDEGNTTIVTIKSVNDDKDYLEASAEKISQFGSITATLQWSDITDPQILKTKATNWLNQHSVRHKTYTVTAVDMQLANSSIESWNVGDLVPIESDEIHGIDETLICNKQTINLIKKEQSSLILGAEVYGYTSSVNGPLQSKLNTLSNQTSIAEIQAATGYKSILNVYYRATVDATPTITTSTEISAIHDDTDNEWTYLDPKPKTNRFYYTCIRYVDKADHVSFTSVKRLNTVSVITNWCNSTNATYIDGSNIYTGTVNTDQLAANAITAAKISAGAVTANKISVTDLQAIGATIGGWTISSTAIYKDAVIDSKTYRPVLNCPTTITSGSTAFAVYNATDSTYPFRVTYTGALTATNATISGTITTGALTATGGTIGGWKIGTQYLTGGDASAGTETGMGTTANWAFYAGYKSDGTYKFRVTQAGALTATNATITGTITATSGNIGGWTINSTSLYKTGTIGSTTYKISLNSPSTITSSTFAIEVRDITNDDPIFQVRHSGMLYSKSCYIGDWYMGNKNGTSIISCTKSNYILQLTNPTSNPSTNNVFQIGTTGGVVACRIQQDGHIYCTQVHQSSDRRHKTNIKSLGSSENFIYRLNPVSFSFKDNTSETHHGFIAQDVKDLVTDDWGVVDRQCFRDPDTNNITQDQYSIAYTELIADLVAVVQSQNERIKALEEANK